MSEVNIKTVTTFSKKTGTAGKVFNDFVRNRSLYLMLLPVLAFYILFCYKPMYGAIIAFKDYSPGSGVWGSDWVGFKHFKDFFGSFFFMRTLKNTLVISITSLVVGFPAPIILALLFNELKNKYFARLVQTVSYMPHFISLVVVCGLVRDFTMDRGLINTLIAFFGGERVTMLNEPGFFVPIYVISGIWQEIGWGSIIYLAALAGINQDMYESSTIDGAGKWKQMLNISLPGLAPTIIILLILRVGSIMNLGFEKIILLYNPAIYETSDVISSFVYRKGILEFGWSYSSAVGLFNSVVNFILLFGSNWISRKVNETSLW